MSNMSSNLILEGLYRSRIDEAVTKEVQAGVKDFEKKAKMTPASCKLVSNLLNMLYIESNKLGANNFTYPKYKFYAGGAEERGDAESGPMGLDVSPDIHEFSFCIFFDGVNDSSAQYKTLQKAMSKHPKIDGDFDPDDGYVITLETSRDNEYDALRASIDKIKKGVQIKVFRYSAPYGFRNEAKNDVRGQILKTEGITSADIATPSGKLNPEKSKENNDLTCIKCGSNNVILTSDNKYHCTDCDAVWHEGDSEPEQPENESGNKKRKSIKAKVKESTVSEALDSGAVASQKRVHRYVIYKQSSYGYNVSDYDIACLSYGLDWYDKKAVDGIDAKSISYAADTVAQAGQIGKSKFWNATVFPDEGEILKSGSEDEAIKAIQAYLDKKSGIKNQYKVLKSKYDYRKPVKW